MTRTDHIPPNTTSGTTPTDRTVAHTGGRGADGFAIFATRNIQYHSALKAPPISGYSLYTSPEMLINKGLWKNSHCKVVFEIVLS